MKTLETSFLSLLLLACCDRKQPFSENKLAGSYARETSFGITHPETGKPIGQSTIRDTILIRESGQGFQISQVKWRLNDFDQRGWQDQQHAENRPFHPYQATFDPTESLLQPITPGVAPPMLVDVNRGLLYQGQDRQRSYRRVR